MPHGYVKKSHELLRLQYDRHYHLVVMMSPIFCTVITIIVKLQLTLKYQSGIILFNGITLSAQIYFKEPHSECHITILSGHLYLDHDSL